MNPGRTVTTRDGWARFAVPRTLAALAAACVVLATSVYPAVGYGWRESASLLCAACVFGWLSHAMCETLRREAKAAHDARRILTEEWSQLERRSDRLFDRVRSFPLNDRFRSAA